MKKMMLWLLLGLAMVGNRAVCASSLQQEAIAAQDSAVDVVGWFNKYDTLTYWITESHYKIGDGDTVKRMQASMKVRVNVTEATDKGYKMEYTFLEFPMDTASGASLADLQNMITEQIGPKIIGTTIRFETDELGRITKYTNLAAVKKQAKSFFKEVVNELSRHPVLQEMKKRGFDVKSLYKYVVADALVDGYIAELKMLFMMHGLSIRLGETVEHEDATDSQYENTTLVSAEMDAEDDYHIVYDIINVLPQDDVKALVGGIVKPFVAKSDSIADFEQMLDAAVSKDATYEDYIKIDFISNGWPYKVVSRKSTLIGNSGKVEQTDISLDSFSFAE